MVLEDLDYIYDTLDVECKGYIEWIELKEFDECIFHDPIDIEQLEAAINTVCGSNSNGRCRKEYFPDLVKELERRHFMEEKIKWDFRALDQEDVGRISLQDALFLFKAVHGDKFSQRYWNIFVEGRLDPFQEVYFDEIKLHLCNIPEFASGNGDEEFAEHERLVKSQALKQLEDDYQVLSKLQEDEASLAAFEQSRIDESNRLKNKADNLLNRMDEIGMDALLEDDLDDLEFGGRAKEKVTVTEVLDALKEKYIVLREKLLGEMLKISVGSGMWQALSEHEQHQKLVQIKLKEEKLRKEGKLETMVIHLPGSATALQYNVIGLMGESEAELEKRLKDQDLKIVESGLSSEEVIREFTKKLDSLEKEYSSTDRILIALNTRYHYEHEVLSKKLQGLGEYIALSPLQREKYLFSLVQARLRGFQEIEFVGASVSVGLSERIQPHKHQRSVTDANRHIKLSESRIRQNKSRRSYDGPVVPPKLFPLKSKLGRVDYVLQLVQECERRYALERQFVLGSYNSRDGTIQRSSSRKLTEGERKKQLSVLLAQWKGWRAKSPKERMMTSQQNKNFLMEALALKLESVKHEMEVRHGKIPNENEVIAEILSSLQQRQDSECQKILNVGTQSKDELAKNWHEQTNAIIEEWHENVAVVLFGIVETSREEEELLKALNDKYDSLRDKLLLESLMNQYGNAEWDRLSQQERQNQLAKMRMLEKKLRREGKYDELAKLLGDAAVNSDLLGKMMGENRQKYLDQLNERLRSRQRRIENGEDPDVIDEEEGGIEERPHSSTGNILKDLDKRFEDERDALLRKLREEQDRQTRERERQAELARLRLEARKAEREANFDGAALVLGLAERNKAALEDRLKNDRERQEKLARERLAARRNRKKTNKEDDPIDPIEPEKDDITGWQDSVLKEIERKHGKERNLLLDLLQEGDSEDFKQEAREMSLDERNQRLIKLKEKRDELDLSMKSEQEEHVPILEMALSVKYINKQEDMKNRKTKEEENVIDDDVIVAMTADLQQLQDEETRKLLEMLPNMTIEELVSMHSKQIEEQKEGRVENLASMLFGLDSNTSDNEIVKALDKKYDTLMDKLLLEALEKQMGDAEWARMNEQERQRLIMKKRLEQKKLLREGKFDEAARLLGDGFKTEANLKNLMGENKKRYQELLEQRLRERREKIARGEPVDDLAMEELPEDEDIENLSPADAKTLLEDLQKRYDSEKDELLARLHGSDKKFMDEKERQAELIRLKREQRRAQQEEKFGAAALVFGLAERNQNAAQERLKNDRTRQEQLARERLERLRNKKNSRIDDEKEKIVEDGDGGKDNLIKLLEKRHALEQSQLVDLFAAKDKELLEQYQLLSLEQRQLQLEGLANDAIQPETYNDLIKEMVPLKHCNRSHALTYQNKNEECTDDNVLVSILADLQQLQDKESSEVLKQILEMDNEQLTSSQGKEMKACKEKQFINIINLLSMSELIKKADDNVLVEALESKYDTLKDKLILDSLEKQMGAANWSQMNERQRQQELLKTKLQHKKLQREGKLDEAARLMGNLLKNDANVQSMLGATKEEQERRLKERLEKRKQREQAGMLGEEVDQLEEEEDKEFEEQVTTKSTGNVLQDLQKNFDAEKEALLKMLSSADSKMNNERKRQLELARLRREARKAQVEEKFGAAALVMGMAKSNQAALDAKLKGSRNRQEQLARERIQAMKNKRQAERDQRDSSDNITSLLDTDDVVQLQENVLSSMEKKHSDERGVMINLAQTSAQNEHREKAKGMSAEEKEAQLFKLKELRKSMKETGCISPDEQNKIFNEAINIKLEQLHDTDNTKSDDEHTVKLLADLQDCQDKEAANVMKDLDQKNIETMKQLVQIQLNGYQNKTYDNLASVLLDNQAADKMVDEKEEELIRALKEKYDAVKDKIYEEALKAKFGEEKWNNMSEKEKQENILAMKAMNEFDINDDDVTNNLDSISIPGMEKIIGKTRAKQDKKMRERMEKRRQAKSEGKSLDQIEKEEQEDENNIENDVKNGSEALKNLQDQFEAEKDAILSMLQNRDTKELNERERQLALARLRRDKMRIKKEEKYDGAALVLNMAKTNQAKKDASLENERGRQEQLARERIAARKKKLEERRNKNVETIVEQTEEEKLAEEEKNDKLDDLSTVEQLQREGTLMAQQHAVVHELEKKHENEQEILLDLMNSRKSDASEQADHLPGEDTNEKLNLLFISRNKLKEEVKRFIDSQPPESEMSEDEKDVFKQTIASLRNDQNNLLEKGLCLKLVEAKAKLISDNENNNNDDNKDDEKLSEEISVKFMADLQERQTIENNALLQAMMQSDTEMLERLKNDQRKARRGGWHDNITSIIFDEKKQKTKNTVSDGDHEEQIAAELEMEEANLQKEVEEEMEQFQKKMEEEKQKQLASMSEDEMNAFIKELKKREEEKMKTLKSQLDKQRERARERMLEKRRKREEKDYESDMASAMIVNAQKRTDMLREKTMALQGAQKDSLEERLRKRREERKRKLEEESEQLRQAEVAEKQKLKEEQETKEKNKQEEEQKKIESSKEPGTDKGDSSEPTFKAEETSEPQVKKKKPKLPLPGGGMKREKTVVEKAAEISDSKKQEMIKMMMSEQTTMAMKINKEQSRQEELVRQLREKRRRKVEARNEQAAAVIGLGARQKTIVEDKKKSERERQIEQIRERVNRIKYERTIGSKEPHDENEQTFANIAQETDHDKMEQLARQMEKKFKESASEPTAESKEVKPEDEINTLERQQTMGRGKLDEKTRAQILKERQKTKKAQRASIAGLHKNTDMSSENGGKEEEENTI